MQSLNYSLFKILALAEIVLAAWLCKWLDISFLWLIAPIVALLFYIVRGSLVLQSQFFFPVVSKGNEKGISLTFDDGPNPEFTPQVLDVLNKHQACATFFVIGERIKGNESIVSRIVNDGHILGNHSYSHSNTFPFYSFKRIIKELEQTNKEIESITGKKMTWFRPPFGIASPRIAKAIAAVSMNAIAWNLRSFDTKKKTGTQILKSIKDKLSGKDIILLHDNASKTIEALDELLNYCTKHGIKVVPLDVNLKMNPYVA